MLLTDHGTVERAITAEDRLDFVIFFWDPIEPHPHDVDVEALLRIAVVDNVPIACNHASADFLLSSPLMERGYERRLVARDGTGPRLLPATPSIGAAALAPPRD